MRQVNNAWRHMRRTPYQALAAILTMTVTFFVASVFVLLAFGFQVVLYYFEAKPQITAYLSDDVSKDRLTEIEKKLQDTGKVSNLKYISKEEALAIYREQSKSQPLLLEMVTANILPSSLEISATNVKYLGDLAQVSKEEQGVDDVVFQKDIVDTLTTWTNAIRLAGSVLVGILIFNSILIILMVIGMKISARREEIVIMQLIGASRWYIRWPFLLEGMIYGALGAFVAFVVSLAILLYLTPALSIFLTGIPLLPLSPIFLGLLFGGEIMSGLIIGTIGSILAVWRYLK